MAIPSSRSHPWPYTRRRLGPTRTPRASASLTGQVTPIHSRRSSTWSAAFRARLRNCRRRMHTRGATDGATGGGPGASGVTPREVPVRPHIHGSARRWRSQRRPAPRRSSEKTSGADPSHLALLTWLDGRPGAGACTPALPQAGLPLNRPGGSGTEATTAPQPRIKQVPQGVAEHV